MRAARLPQVVCATRALGAGRARYARAMPQVVQQAAQFLRRAARVAPERIETFGKRRAEGLARGVRFARHAAHDRQEANFRAQAVRLVLVPIGDVGRPQHVSPTA
ncbi:MAG: hypothetical protein V9G24_05075 [Rhodoblastus sp.]